MTSGLQDIDMKLFATERDAAETLAWLFKAEAAPGSMALLNRCAIWDKAKYLSQQQCEHFVFLIGIQMPSIYSFVLDTMSGRYRRLTDTVGSLAQPCAAMISMFADETFDDAILSLQSRSELDAGELLKQIADAAWEKHKKQMI
jgi:hypothetical protein